MFVILTTSNRSHSFGFNNITSVLEKSAKPKSSQNSCKMFLAEAARLLPMNSAFVK